MCTIRLQDSCSAEGKGPAWANSLFEDNAEHGLGMYLGQKAIRTRLAEKTRALIEVPHTYQPLKDAAQKWLDTMEDGQANAEATKEYVKLLEESIMPVDACIAFISSPEADKVFGDKKGASIHPASSTSVEG